MIARMRRIGADLTALAGMRVELFGLELREQFDRWLSLAVLAMMTAVLGCIGLAFFAALVTVAFWDANPLVALGVFALLFLGAAAWCARRIAAVVAETPPPFDATLAEFRRDRAAIDPRGDRSPATGGEALP